MGLIQCPDCGKQVSDQATACIHCGRPLAKSLRHSVSSTDVKTGTQRAKWRYEAGNTIGLIGVIASLFVMMSSFPLGILLFLVSAGFGLWLAYFS